jgi:hypothetical protein
MYKFARQDRFENEISAAYEIYEKICPPAQLPHLIQESRIDEGYRLTSF